MITNYETIKTGKTLKDVCRICNTRKIRTIIEEQTLSPFNINKNGNVKTRMEIEDSVDRNLKRRVKRFTNEGFVCRKCKPYLGY